MKKVLLISFFLFVTIVTFATNKFWVGGSGNWSDATNHWALTSGGAPGAGNLPGATDSCIFNAASNTTAYTVTIDATTKLCKGLNFAAPPSVSGTITLAGSTQITNSGSLTLLAGMTITYTGTLLFNSTSSEIYNITCNGKSLVSHVTFDGAGGSWILQDSLKIGITKDLTLTNGTLNTNGKAVLCRILTVNSGGTKTLTLGASTITAGSLTLQSSGTTFNANTSTIYLEGTGATTNHVFSSLTYNNVIVDFVTASVTTHGFLDAATFANLTVLGDIALSTKLSRLALTANITVSGTFKSVGYNAIYRLYITSGTSTLGASRTITAATVSITNTDFQDITGAGAGTWSGYSIGNALGNSGITFTTAVHRYWVGAGSGNWSDSINWSATSGGSGNASIPLCHDTVDFNASSGSGTRTITVDMPRLGSDITFGSLSGAVTLSWNFSNMFIYGSLNTTSVTSCTVANTINFMCRGLEIFTTGGITYVQNITISAVGGTITMQDGLTTTGQLILNNGTFNASGYNITVAAFNSSNSNTRTLTMGSGVWTLTSVGSIWTISTSTNLTVTATTSILRSNDASASSKTLTFSSTSKTFGNLHLTGAGAGAFTVSGTTVFNNDVTIDASNASTSVDLGSMTINGNLDYTGFTGTHKGTNNFSCKGNVTITSAMLFDQVSALGTLTLNSTTANQTLTTNGQDSCRVNITYSGTQKLTLVGNLGFADAAGSAQKGVTHSSGEIDLNGYNVRASFFGGSSASVRVITLGSGTVTIYGASGFLYTGAGSFAVTATTGTIKFTTGTTTVFSTSAAKTWGNIWIDKTAASLITFSGTNTFNDFKFSAVADTIKLTNSTTMTVSTLTGGGSVGVLPILKSTSNGSAATISDASGNNCLDYMRIQDITGTGGAGFYMGANSTNVSGNTGLTFTACPSAGYVHNQVIINN